MSLINQRRIPVFAIASLLLLFSVVILSQKNWQEVEPSRRGVIAWDVIPNYSYLPALFVHQDLKLEFTSREGFSNDNRFWFRETENGGNLIVASMGLSYLYSPFFLAAHTIAPVFGQVRDGFQPVYQFFILLGSLVYLGFGLHFLSKLLLRYYSPVVTGITLLLAGTGTNLFYYATGEAAMPHVYSFSLVALFLYLQASWYDAPGLKNSVFTGLVFGLIVLVKPAAVLLLLVFLFWGAGSIDSLRSRLRFLAGNYLYLLLMLAAFCLPWIPQFLYWKFITGNLFPDTGAVHYFGNPHILDFLFSFRKGWFIYTPLMLLALLGFIPLYRRQRGLLAPVLIFLALFIYVASSHWMWWNGGSFGIRVMVDFIPLMLIPLAALVSLFMDRSLLLRLGALLPVLFIVFLNLFQTWQYNRVLIHWEGMTGESYRTIFLRTEDRYGYWQNISLPDMDLARQGIYVYYPAIRTDTRLLEMEEEEGREYVLYQLRKDRRLIRDIKRYAGRNKENSLEVLDMVVDKAYSEMTK